LYRLRFVWPLWYYMSTYIVQYRILQIQSTYESYCSSIIRTYNQNRAFIASEIRTSYNYWGTCRSYKYQIGICYFLTLISPYAETQSSVGSMVYLFSFWYLFLWIELRSLRRKQWEKTGLNLLLVGFKLHNRASKWFSFTRELL
jgi:hypothetical protein